MKALLKLLGLMLLLIGASAQASQLYTEVPPGEQKDLVDDSNLHIFLCGTGQPEIDMQMIRKPSCLAVVGRGQFALFDAGEGSGQMLAALGLPVNKIKTIFMSHLHADHIGGLGALLISGWDNNGLRSSPLSIYGPWGIEGVVNGLKEVYKPDIYYETATNIHLNPNMAIPSATTIDPGLVDASGKNAEVYQSSGFSVSAFAADHRPAAPALSYKVKFAGCSIVITGDTTLTESYIKNIKDVDLLLSDSINVEMLKAAGGEKAELYAHYHPETISLAKAAAQAKVKNLVLIHIQPATPNDQDSIDRYSKGMQSFYHNPLHVGADGDQIVVSPSCKVTYIPTKLNSGFQAFPKPKDAKDAY